MIVMINWLIRIFMYLPFTHRQVVCVCLHVRVSVCVYYTLWPNKHGLPEFEYSLAKVHESFKIKNYDKYIVTQ